VKIIAATMRRAAPIFLGGTMMASSAAEERPTTIDAFFAQAETRVIAHRGFSAHAPENTLAAVALAIEAGADMVEIDVTVRWW
jgi:glycerophosphoryl diester phosphodiesterase